MHSVDLVRCRAHNVSEREVRWRFRSHLRLALAFVNDVLPIDKLAKCLSWRPQQPNLWMTQDAVSQEDCLSFELANASREAASITSVVGAYPSMNVENEYVRCLLGDVM